MRGCERLSSSRTAPAWKRRKTKRTPAFCSVYPPADAHVNLIAKNRRESHNHRPNIKPKKLPQVEPRRGQERHAQSGIDHKTECLPISASINARKTSGDCNIGVPS